MPCTPLAVDPGLFRNDLSIAWSTAPTTTMGGKTVTRSAAGISVTGPTGAMPFHSTAGGRTSKYLFFGSGNFLVLLDSETGPGPVTHNVSLVDFTTTPPTERPLLTVLASSTAVQPPNVQFSQGAGAAVCVFGSNGTEITNLAIYRSDTGALLCAGPPPFVATGQTEAEATATDLRIHFSSGGTSQVAVCPLPQGRLTVQPASQAFPDVVIGGCAMAPSTRPFTLRNSGTDCLTVAAIGNAGPFSVTTTSLPLPASLTPGQTMTVTVQFSPGAVGATGPTMLPITRTPAQGDNQLTCQGQARGPVRQIHVNQAGFAFGSWPVGRAAPNQTLVISNTGEAPLTVALPNSPAGSPMHWTGFSGVLACGATHSVVIGFTPLAVGAAQATLDITSDAPGSPTHITLDGQGCNDPPIIAVTPGHIDFGTVPVQFYIGRRITVRNSGPCLDLAVTLTTSGAPFFVTDSDPTTLPPASLSVSATLPRGIAKQFVVVFAPTALGPVPAGTLTITHDSPTQPAVTVPLTGTGVTLLPAAWELVLDRSGSMAAAAVGGSKMDALKAAVQLFAQLVLPGRGDSMGSVEFDDAFNVLTPHGVFDAAKQQAMITDAKSLTPRNRTSIGGGLQRGQGEVSGSAVPRKVMLVFTDGLQNTPPAITAVEPGILAAGTEVYAIGLGQAPNLSVGDLSTLAASAGGHFFLTDDTLLLRKYFVQVLADAYRNNLAQDPVINLTAGVPVAVPVNITACERQISFILAWDDPAAQIDFTVEAPDGTLLTPASPAANQLVRHVREATHSYYQIAFPPLDPGSGLTIGPRQIGPWLLRIDPITLPGGAQRCTTSVLVESQLDLRTVLKAVDHTTPLFLEVLLTSDGTPVLDAEVQLTLTAPVRSLAAASTPAVVTRARNADAVPIPTGEVPLIPTQTRTFQLTQRGNGFELELPAPKVDGVYDFVVQARGKACGGTFDRYESFSRYLGPPQHGQPDHVGEQPRPTRQ